MSIFKYSVLKNMHMTMIWHYSCEITSDRFCVGEKVSLSVCVNEDSASGPLQKPDGCGICFSSHGTVDKGWDRWQGETSRCQSPGANQWLPGSNCPVAAKKQDLSCQQDGSR